MELDPKVFETCPVDVGIVVWFLGGPSLAIRSREALLYLDLFTGPSPLPEIVTKAIPEVVNPAKIRWADLAISTHRDPDHCDKHSLTWLHTNTESLFLGPRSCYELYLKWGFALGRIRQIGPLQSFSLKDAAIHAYPSKDAFDPDALTYVAEINGVTIFDGGDTLYTPALRDIGRSWSLDVAILSYARNPPDRSIYMDAEDVLTAADDLRAKTVILKHFDLWQEYRIDPAPLLERLRSNGHDAKVVGLGGSLRFGAPRP